MNDEPDRPADRQPDGPDGPRPGDPDGRPPRPSPGLSTGMAVGFYGVLLLAAWLLGDVWLNLDLIRWHDGWDQPIWVDALVGAGLGLVFVVLTRIFERTMEWARVLTREFRKILGGLTLTQVAVFAVTSGIAEEVFFRGFLQQALSELAFNNEWIGLVVASLVFGLIHIGPDREKFLPWTIMAVVLGFVFGLVYMYTGNIVAPVVAHFTINFFNLKHIARPTGPENSREEDEGEDGE